MPVEIEDSAWPIVTLRIRGVISCEEEDRFIGASVAFPDRGERYVVVIDLLEAKTPSSRFVREQAAAIGKREEMLGTYCAGIAFVIDSAMLRGGVRAVFSLSPAFESARRCDDCRGGVPLGGVKTRHVLKVGSSRCDGCGFPLVHCSPRGTWHLLAVGWL